MLKLYYAKGTCALASHLALQEAGAEYETAELNFANGEQKSAPFLQVNAKARVPALQTDRGILTETPAILLYIAQQYPKARLAPLDDPFALAQMQAVNSYLCSTVHVAHAHAARGERWTDDAAAIAAMKTKVPETMGACFDLIERQMIQGPWVMGNEFSVADPYLFTIARWLERDGVDVRNYPKVAAHFDAISQRAASQVVLPLHQK